MKNICKFVNSDINSQLVPIRYILESDPEVMRKGLHPKSNRMVLVVQQQGRFNLGGRFVPCSTGDIIVFFENETYYFEGDEGFKYMYIDFTGLRSAELFRRFGINESNRVLSGFDGLIPLWMESLSRASEKNIDLAAESILLYTFSRFTENGSKKANCINKIIEMTEEEFSDPYLSISTIADALGYNSKYLSHIFKEEMGVGFTEYLRTYRIKYAVSLFEHGIDSIKNVALLSGFTDPLYFSTVFKNHIGVSPKSYIKSFYNKQSEAE